MLPQLALNFEQQKPQKKHKFIPEEDAKSKALPSSKHYALTGSGSQLDKLLK